MTVSFMQIIAAVAMMGAAVALVLGYRKYLAANSERRMRVVALTRIRCSCPRLPGSSSPGCSIN